MRIKDRFILSLSVLFLLFISACEDPSSVGLVDDAGGNAIVDQLPIANFESIPVDGVNSGTDRLLVGQVDDPVLGQISASAYIDFRLDNRPSDNYLNGEVDSLILNLTLDTLYTYGNPNEEIIIDVFEVTSEFEIVSEREELPDQEASPLFQFSVLPGTRTVAVPFPDDWVQENNQLLRPAIPEVVSDNAFNSDFHGIRLVPVSGNGFIRIFANTTLSFLQGIDVTEDDSDTDPFVNYLAGSDISVYDRLTEPELPAGRALLQSDVGANIELNIGLSELTDFASVNRAALEVSFDTTTFVAADDFVRPTVDNVTLVGIVSDSLANSVEALEACGAPNVSVCILSSSRITDSATFTFDDSPFRREIERRSLGQEVFSHYELRFSVPNAANAVILHDMDSPENSPSFVLTYTILN